MRRLPTAGLVVVLAVIATAALIDAFGGRSDEPRLTAATKPAATTTAPLPVCDRDQLALKLEVLGATNAVSLRHVKGAPCRAAGFDLRVYVTSDGRRSEIPLGEESVLDGDFSPNVERSIPFSVCRAGSTLTAEAIAGPYRASGPIQPGGENCEGAIRDVSVDLGRQPGTMEFRISPLDPATHATSFVIDFPRKADLRVTAQAGIGPLLEVLDSHRLPDCRPIGRRISCVVTYGFLGEGARERWTIAVLKRSEGRAHVSVAISFIPANG